MGLLGQDLYIEMETPQRKSSERANNTSSLPPQQAPFRHA